MKPWLSLIQTIQAGQPAILALVVDSSGSAPGKAGFKMVVDKLGRQFGTIGGGIMEARIIEKCQEMLAENQTGNRLLLQIHNDQADGELRSGMICAGRQRILLQPIQPVDLETLNRLEQAEEKAKPVVLVFDARGFRIVEEGAEEASRTQFRQPQPGQWEYREVVGRREIFYIVGGGHVGLALSQALSPLGFYLVVFDHRPNLDTFATNPFAHQKKVCDYEAIGEHVKPGTDHYLAVVTATFQSDMAALASVIHHRLRYIGLMGSQAKVRRIFAGLKEKGITKAQLQKVTAPMGMPIGNRTPAEIAVSVAAQIVAVRNGVATDTAGFTSRARA